MSTSPDGAVAAGTRPATQLPGLTEARTYLDRETRRLDPIPDWPEPAPVTPDLALDALMLLRLGRAVAVSGVELPPAPGCVVVLAVGERTDRSRAARCLCEFIPREQNNRMRILSDEGGPHGRRSMSRCAIEDELLGGYPVVAICARADNLPDGLEPLVEATLPVPVADAAMIGALLSLLHPGQPVEVDVPDADIARLSPAQLLPVVAAPDAARALAVLRRMCAAQAPRSGQITLADVHGQPQAVAALEQVVVDLQDWRAGAIVWPDVVRSFLLIGPPGTGKTMLAEALAGSARVPLIKTSYSDCQRRGHQGDMLAALHKAAEQAIRSAPSVFFVDEVDSFHVRGGRHDSGYIIGVVNGLLTLIDRLSATEGVVLIAATNDAQRVDPAVIRHGRFDRHLRIGPPDRAGLRGMLQANLPQGLLTGVEIDGLVDQILGLSGASVAALLRDARTRARAARRPLAADDVAAAADAYAPPADMAVLWRVAVHEAGHLLIAHLLRLAPPHSAQVTMHGGFVVRPYPRLLSRASVRAWLRTHLAGRAAEEVVFGEISSGAGGGEDSDLAKATRLALEAEGALGFGLTLSWLPSDLPLYLMPAALRDRVEAALQEAAADATARLTGHRSALERIARTLLDRRELDGPALAALLADAVPGRDPEGDSPSGTAPDTPHAG